MENAVKVILVDDNQLFRRGLKTLLESQPGLNIVGDADNAEQAIVMARELSPDVVVTDLVLGKISGIELIRVLRPTAGDGPRVVAMSARADAATIAEAAAAGACAFVSKLVTTDQIVHAIWSTVSDKRCLEPGPGEPSSA